MIDKLDNELHFNREALNLRVQRQKVLANNIANADTPGFKARDIDFSKTLQKAVKGGLDGGAGLKMKTTSDRHFQGSLSGASAASLKYRVPDQVSMDGNTVDMDRERSQFADNNIRHEASLKMLSSSISRIKSAMQPE